MTAMAKTTRLIIGVPFCFTLLVCWFAWSAWRAAPPLAAETLRGAGFSIAAAIEQLVLFDASFHSLSRYSTPDIAYIALLDRHGVIKFHSNPALIGTKPEQGSVQSEHRAIHEERELLGTGEEVYLLRTAIHADHEELRLVLALHTYRADQVIRRARAGVTVLAALTVALWGATIMVLYMARREERHQVAMRRREELARLGELGALMAHEIRNPLAGIKGYAQLTESAVDLSQARQYADVIISQSLRMEALVDDLLSFARADQGERTPVDVLSLVRECVMLLRMESGAVSILFDHADTLQLMASVAGDRIVQMLLNLMKNGIQAMPDGGTLRVAVCENAGSAEIRIADSGVGIPDQHLPHIFEPFWTSKARGTGLGLALCLKIAQEHGGTLELISTVGVGTTVTVRLPLTE